MEEPSFAMRHHHEEEEAEPFFAYKTLNAQPNNLGEEIRKQYQKKRLIKTTREFFNISTAQLVAIWVFFQLLCLGCAVYFCMRFMWSEGKHDNNLFYQIISQESKSIIMLQNLFKN